MEMYQTIWKYVKLKIKVSACLLYPSPIVSFSRGNMYPCHGFFCTGIKRLIMTCGFLKLIFSRIAIFIDNILLLFAHECILIVFEINLDSRNYKNSTESCVPFTQLSLVVTSYIAIVQYQNQNN